VVENSDSEFCFSLCPGRGFGTDHSWVREFT